VVTAQHTDLTVAEVAALLRVTVPTVRNWIKHGELEAWAPGGSRAGYRITPAALARFRAERGGN
jgi:excisionase family DNA binding protein